MRVRAKPTSSASRQPPLRAGTIHLHPRFTRVQGYSISTSSSQAFNGQTEHEPPEGREDKEDDSTHIAGKWGELAEVLFPEVLALDGDVEDEPPEGLAEANAVPADVAAHLGRLVSNTSSGSEVMGSRVSQVEAFVLLCIGQSGDDESALAGRSNSKAFLACLFLSLGEHPSMHVLLGVKTSREVAKDPQQPTFPSTSYCTNCCCPLTSMPSSSNICLECGWSDEHGQESEAASSPLLDPSVPLQWSALAQAQQKQQQQPVRQGLHPGVALGFDERMLLHRASLPPYPE
eukprot:scaffold97784_cov22-Tisochrysis_lutea.AAC.1